MDAIREQGACRADPVNAEYVAAILKGEVDRLVRAGVPEYGTLTITATLAAGDVSRVELSAGIGRKLAPRSARNPGAVR